MIQNEKKAVASQRNKITQWKLMHVVMITTNILKNCVATVIARILKTREYN